MQRSRVMREHILKFPELAFLAVTRGMLGFGAGLLVSERFRRAKPRRILGGVLLGIGALSTIPLAIHLFRGRKNHHPTERTGY